MKKIIFVIIAIFLVVFFIRVCLVEGASGHAPGYNFAGITDSDKLFNGIQSSISYANPNVIGSKSFSLEGLMLKDETNSSYSWVETGWVKDNRYNMTVPYGFLENKQGYSFTYTYFTISHTTHNYKLVYVGQTADYRYVYACYYDGIWEARGFVYSKDLLPEVKGEVYNSGYSYSEMGPASIYNIQLLHSGSWMLWRNSYPALHTEYFENDPPYYLIINNPFYNIYNYKR